MKSLFGSHINVVGTVLDLQLQRQNVVMSNIANIKTPRYQPMEFEFEADLQDALALDERSKLARTDQRHMPARFDANSFSGELSKDFKPREIHGEDRVNLDKEMAKLAKNSLQYNALVTVIRGNFEGIKNIITESKA